MPVDVAQSHDLGGNASLRIEPAKFVAESPDVARQLEIANVIGFFVGNATLDPQELAFGMRGDTLEEFVGIQTERLSQVAGDSPAVADFFRDDVDTANAN